MELYTHLNRMESKYQPIKQYFYKYVNNQCKKDCDYEQDMNTLTDILSKYTTVEFCNSNAGHLAFLCCGVLFNTTIEKIEVFQEAVNLDNIEYFVYLIKHRKIKSLCFNSLYPPPDFFVKLNTKLHELEIVSTNFTRQQAVQFRNFLTSANCDNLKVLRLSEFDFSVINRMPLETLVIEQPRNLTFHPNIKYLKRLHLANIELVEIADSLKVAMESTQTITELVFKNITFSSCTCRKLSSGFQKNTSLVELEFSHCQFGKFRYIYSAIAQHRSIEHLKLKTLDYRTLVPALKYILENNTIIHTLTFSKADNLLPYKEYIEASMYITKVNHHLHFPNLDRNRIRKKQLLIQLLASSRALMLLDFPYELQKLVFNELCVQCMVASKHASSLSKYMLTLQPVDNQEEFSLEVLLNKSKRI